MQLLTANGKFAYVHVLDVLVLRFHVPLYDSAAYPAVRGSEIDTDASGKATILASGNDQFVLIDGQFVYTHFQDERVDGPFDPSIDATPRGITGLFLPLSNESVPLTSTCSPPPPPPTLPPPPTAPPPEYAYLEPL